MALLLFPDVNFEAQKEQLAFGSFKSNVIQDSFSLIDSSMRKGRQAWEASEVEGTRHGWSHNMEFG